MSIFSLLLAALLMGLGLLSWCVFTGMIVRLVRRRMNKKSADFWIGPYDNYLSIPFGLYFGFGGAIIAKWIFAWVNGTEYRKEIDSYIVVGWLNLPVPLLILLIVRYVIRKGSRSQNSKPDQS